MWDIAIERVMSRTFLKGPSARNNISADEWLSDPASWSTSGGSSVKGKIDILMPDGKVKKAHKTKLSTALLYSPAEIKEMMFKKMKQKNKVIRKREVLETRPAIAGDFELYMKMTYISHIIKGCMDPKKSLLFQNKQEQLSTWYEMIASCKNWCFPFDQSGFDQHVDLFMVLSVVQWMQKWMKLWPRINKDALTIMDLIYYALDGGETLLTDNHGKTISLPIEGGIMSGWRWTSMLDTLVNEIQLETWKVWYEEKYNTTPYIFNDSYFGDDISMRMYARKYASSYFSFMKHFGYGVHPMKVFVAKGRDEFLRKMITQEGAIGYPARAVNTILWRNPVSPEPTRGKLRISEQVENWATLISRGMDANQVYRYLIRDISRANHILKKDVEALLNTPKSVGGYGWYIGNEKFNLNHSLDQRPADRGWVTIEEEIIPGRQPEIVSELKGLSEIDKFWGFEIKLKPSELGAFNSRYVEPMLREVTPVELDINIKAKSVTLPWNPWLALGYLAKGDLAPEWSEDVPEFFRANYLLKMIRDGDKSSYFPRIQSYIRNFGLSKIIYQNGGKRVWIDWLLGRLPFLPPLIPMYDNSLVEVVYNVIISHMFGKLLKKKFSYKHVQVAALTAEYWTKKHFDETNPLPRLGR